MLQQLHRGLAGPSLAALTWALAAAAVAAPPQFEITFSSDVRAKPYTGRVFIITTRAPDEDPIDTINIFSVEPLFAQDVENWKPGEVLRFDAARCLGYPHRLADLPAGRYGVQAVMNMGYWTWDVLRAPGNGISARAVLDHDPGDPATVKLGIDRTLPLPELRDREQLRYVRMRSRLLSDFHERDVFMHAAVILPDGYADEPERRFPTIYVIPGFSSTIYNMQGNLQIFAALIQSVGFDAVVIYLDADCPTGHHVFADSANNGPCGTALVKEFIPHIEERFRLIPRSEARYVTGISSGGWSSLWVQITHPEFFGGVWSMSPDPVDFRAFSQVNIYKPGENVFRDADGNPREVMRQGLFGEAMTYEQWTRLEDVVGRGGQMYSFDAVFGPRGPDDRPRFLYNHETGAIDPAVAEHWKKYDIRLFLESNWNTLGPKLKGKLHLYCGDRDDFFLDKPFYLLRDALRRLGSDAHVEVVPGGYHMLPPMTLMRIAREMYEHHQRSGVEQAERKREAA